MADRNAGSAIKGFLYQFHKTIKEILCSSYDDIITVEGVCEDIDILHNGGNFSFIQCKNHEGIGKYTNSIIYKPLLQMASHYSKNPDLDVIYKIFIHAPSEKLITRNITATELSNAMSSKNKSLMKIIENISDDFDSKSFLSKVFIEFAPSYNSLVDDVNNLLSDVCDNSLDVDNILRPNAISYIADMSIKELVSERAICRGEFEKKLRSLNDVVINSWTLLFRSKKDLLALKRKQLVSLLNYNTKRRCLFFSKKNVRNFNSGIVSFIMAYVHKYHYKPAHIYTPILVLDMDLESMQDIENRLYKKNILSNTGIVGNKFELSRFIMEASSSHKKEFHVKLLSSSNFPDALLNVVIDDVFYVCDKKPENLSFLDSNEVIVNVISIPELEYVFSIRSSYE